ncbi:uncharacterized protein TNCV_2396111 [Trichonephila clavipes]|uniref:Uncharacterized protein n=1 Tax=Trichonephila clavipes TaxID=2585209 RepID=A0A8X6VH35_TRICX|nr:uncharacterized protein TNCV_2396111 [Trichonephila clavipes]
MNSLLKTLLKVTVVVLCTRTFSPVQAMEKSTFHPSVVYTVSILSDDQRTNQDTFVDTFVQLVYESNTLKDLFDFSETPAFEFASHTHKRIADTVASLGAKNPERIADFATRPMAQNFKVFTREEMVRVYSSVAASYLYSQGILIQDDAKDLANQYADACEKSANETVVENDPTSKFKAIGNGLEEFLMLKDTLTVEKAWMGVIYYESEWLLTAAETPASRDLFVRCSAEANGDPN